MMHVARDGSHKFLRECTLPLTGVGAVNRIITDLAVFDLTPEGLAFVRLTPGWLWRRCAKTSAAPSFRPEPGRAAFLYARAGIERGAGLAARSGARFRNWRDMWRRIVLVVQASGCGRIGESGLQAANSGGRPIGGP